MPDRNRKPQGARPEFEVAYYTKELGKTLQREMLRKQLARLSSTATGPATPAGDASPSTDDIAPHEENPAGPAPA